MGLEDKGKLLDRKVPGPWRGLKITVPSKMQVAASILGACPSKSSVAPRCRSNSKAGLFPLALRLTKCALHSER